MVIPQVNGTVKGLLAVACTATGTALIDAFHKGTLSGWGTLGPALYDSSFTGFMALVAATIAWLAIRSPLSQSSKDDRNLVKTVEATTGMTGDDAKSMALYVKAKATTEAIQTVVQGTGDGRQN